MNNFLCIFIYHPITNHKSCHSSLEWMPHRMWVPSSVFSALPWPYDTGKRWRWTTAIVTATATLSLVMTKIMMCLSNNPYSLLPGTLGLLMLLLASLPAVSMAWGAVYNKQLLFFCHSILWCIFELHIILNWHKNWHTLILIFCYYNYKICNTIEC